MLVMPILNKTKNGINKIYNVEVKLKKANKVKEGVIVRGLEESDISINGTSFNKSIYNTKGIEPNVLVNFLRNYNYRANKKDFLISTREATDSNLYDLYNVEMPPRKIAAGLDNLYGSTLLDMKKELPDKNKGRYISLKKLGVDNHITEEKINKLRYIVETEKDPIRRDEVCQLSGVSDLEKTINYMDLFDFTIINEATLTEEQLLGVMNALNNINTKDSKSLGRLYEIAKENKEVYGKLTTISKIINNKPLNLIKTSRKNKILVKDRIIENQQRAS